MTEIEGITPSRLGHTVRQGPVSTADEMQTSAQSSNVGLGAECDEPGEMGGR